MKLIIKNDSKETVKNPNVKIIETTEASFANQTVFIEENDVPIIKFTDTESMHFVKDLDNLYDRKSKSEVLLDITIDNLELISLGGSSFNIKGQFENNTEAINNDLLIGDIYSLPIIDDVSLLAVVVQTYNFDLTSPNWASEGITDEASFINWLATRSSDNSNDLTNIAVTDFNFVGDRIFCNMTADGTIYDLGGLELVNADKIGVVNGLIALALIDNKIVTFNPSIPLPSSLLALGLSENQIEDFNPSIPLPSSLIELSLSNNQMTLAGYTASEVWANSQPAFTNPCKVDFIGNIDSITGTNLEAILLTKNCVIIP